MNCALVNLAGHSKTDAYTPSNTMSGEEIFNLNCTKCHKPEADAVIRLSSDKTSKEAILKQIQSGSMSMPPFPNIKGEPGERLTKYILETVNPSKFFLRLPVQELFFQQIPQIRFLN